MKLSNKFLLIAGAIVITGCALLPPSLSTDPIGSNLVVTTSSQVEEGTVIPPENVIEFSALSEELQEQINEVLPPGDTLVVVKENQLLSEDSPRIPMQLKEGQTITEAIQDPTVWNTIVGGLTKVLSGIAPEGTPLWMLLGLLFKKPRAAVVATATKADNIVTGLLSAMKKTATLKNPKEDLVAVKNNAVQMVTSPCTLPSVDPVKANGSCLLDDSGKAL